MPSATAFCASTPSAIGLDPNFTVLDRGDAADLMNLVRDELRLSEQDRRFPKKATCLAIYSYAVNARASSSGCCRRRFPGAATGRAS